MMMRTTKEKRGSVRSRASGTGTEEEEGVDVDGDEEEEEEEDDVEEEKEEAVLAGGGEAAALARRFLLAVDDVDVVTQPKWCLQYQTAESPQTFPCEQQHRRKTNRISLQRRE